MFEQISQEMEAENAVGLILAAQLYGSPEAMQAVVQTALFEPAGLRPQNQYVIQMAQVVEHQIVLGLFNTIEFTDNHPLLHAHNASHAAIYLASKADDPGQVLRDMQESHDHLYGEWRDLRESLNQLSTAGQVFAAGYGLLGEMPRPFADTVSAILTRHGVKHNMVETSEGQGMYKALILDNTYFVAAEITVEIPRPTEA
jgi:hypothetical protein